MNKETIIRELLLITLCILAGLSIKLELFSDHSYIFLSGVVVGCLGMIILRYKKSIKRKFY